jgi:hypothetical protein
VRRRVSNLRQSTWREPPRRRVLAPRPPRLARASGSASGGYASCSNPRVGMTMSEFRVLRVQMNSVTYFSMVLASSSSILSRFAATFSLSFINSKSVSCFSFDASTANEAFTTSASALAKAWERSMSSLPF